MVRSACGTSSSEWSEATGEMPRRQAAKQLFDSPAGHQKIIMVSDHDDFFMQIKGKFKLEIQNEIGKIIQSLDFIF